MTTGMRDATIVSGARSLAWSCCWRARRRWCRSSRRRRRSRTAAATLDLSSQDPNLALQRIRVQDGYEVNLFASEQQFPELANPLAMTFDVRGRLWVLTSPTYPHYLPGEEPNDKLVILEDTNEDGKADKLTVFADKLYIPTGFELGDGGVYVSQQPNLMFLRDTDGDDRADERRIVLHGFGTEDSHHAHPRVHRGDRAAGCTSRKARSCTRRSRRRTARSASTTPPCSATSRGPRS